MMTRHMKIWRQIRSARVSALSEEERRQELREAEERGAHGHGRSEPAVTLPPSRLEPPPHTRAS
jgi:hypothetical protein